MRQSEIVDWEAAAAETPRQRWRRVMRFGVPVLGVVLIVAAIAATAVYDYRTDRRDVLALSQDFISTLDDRIRSQVEYAFRLVNSTANTAAAMPEELFADPPWSSMEKLLLQFLKARTEYAQAYFGRPNGDFLMVTRQKDGALDTKLIDHSEGRRRTTWIRRDLEGSVTGREEDPSDTYDPRVRPWYGAAVNSEGAHWTDVYVFFEKQEPGITASRASISPDGQVYAVSGFDISLHALSEFLSELRVGTNGIAMIIDGEGRLVAYPDPDKVVRRSNDTLTRSRVDELGNPLLSEVFDRVRIAGPGRSIMEVDGERYIVSASPLSGTIDRDWTLLFVIPENDFVGFVTANNRNAVLMSLGIIVLAIGLASLLAYQGLVSDRNARAVERRQHALEEQSGAFAELASMATLFDPEDLKSVQKLNETTARALAARRVGVWQLEASGDGIVCIDCFDRETKGHTSSTQILGIECPRLMAALLSGDEIVAADASQDPRTAELHEAYLQAVGCRSLLSVPVVNRNGVVGFVWVEDTAAIGERHADARTFVRVAANMIGARFVGAPAATAQAAGESSAKRPAPIVPTGDTPDAGGARAIDGATAMRTASLIDERNRRHLEEVTRRGMTDGKLKATVFPRLTVLALKLGDDMSLATATDDGEDTMIIEHLVEVFMAACNNHNVPYLKLLTDQIVAASGFEENGSSPAAGIAEVALEIRDRCARIFAGLGQPPDYRIGIDTGTAMGSMVGFGSRYNIWGEAVRVASTMSETARPGTIQVTESTYGQLQDRYLFRRRGGFFLGGTGDITTYVLRTRL